MIVVSDTTPLSSLIHINRLSLLKDLFQYALIPAEVTAEMDAIPYLSLAIKINSSWIDVVEIIDQLKKTELMLVLDEGESAAIALAIERKADLILMDERNQKSIAEEYGVQSTGTLGVLLQAKRMGLIKEVKPDILKLKQQYNFWVSDQLISQILILANEV